jgi:hypothetical protein
MTAKTRYFAIASLLVLTVGLGTGLVAYYVGYSPFPAGGTDELRFLPANASLVAFADVRHIMTSPLRQKLRTLLPLNGDSQRDFRTRTGIDVETDIDRVVAAFAEVPSSSGGQEGAAALVVARGRFDFVKIEALMREHGGRVDQYKGKRIIEADTQAPRSLSIAFLDPGLLAVGSSNLIRSAVDLADGGPSVTTNDELMKLVRDLESGNAWAVGRFDALASRARFPAGVSANLSGISWFSATASIDSGVAGVFRAEARDEQAAGAFRDVVWGVLSLAKLQAPARPEFQQLLGSLQLAGTGKTVALSFEIPPTVFDALGSRIPQVPR